MIVEAASTGEVVRREELPGPSANGEAAKIAVTLRSSEVRRPLRLSLPVLLCSLPTSYPLHLFLPLSI